MGINSIYGVFQEFYTSPETNIVDAQGQDALVSLVGTLGYGLTWGGGIFVNPLIVRVKNLKIITLTGTTVMSLGLILASFSTRLWHLFLTQAIMYGLGATFLYFTIMSLAPQFYDRNRGFAMGFILSGIGVGGLVLAPTIHALIQSVGIRWTLRILGLWTFVMMAPVACVPRHPPGFEARRRGGPGGTRLNASLLKRGTFVAQSVGCFLQAAGNIVPLFYLTTFSTSVLQYSASTGSLLLALNNAVNSVARILMGLLADRVGRQNTLVISVLLSSISVLALWYNASQARFIAFVVLYGVLAGGYNALLPTTISEVYGIQNYNAVNGSIYFLRGLGAIVGPPIAGAILGSHSRGTVISSTSGIGSTSPALAALEEKYNDLVIYTGMLLVGASFCVAYVRWGDAKEKGKWQWKA
ncbi:monocarboxylate transporter [Fomitiporia mediterranea MF3/22]|uniref:monocarboxylate transporter n=1 Tax=Fomitiporia mediterranea (strain MF3/22) TaxID=694068 RepID=UPI00044099F7|nr:monocarboxylate transporter [Fomitiporia mediterranea MF3/22]EJD03008.1 monocarboxylate transporter [Fomitiporia mediterranea MF3/22]